MKNVFMVWTWNTDGHDGGYDHFDGEFTTLADAIKCADRRWAYMAKSEQSVRETYVTTWEIDDDVEVGNGDAMGAVHDACGGEGNIVYRPGAKGE